MIWMSKGIPCLAKPFDIRRRIKVFIKKRTVQKKYLTDICFAEFFSGKRGEEHEQYVWTGDEVF